MNAFISEACGAGFSAEARKTTAQASAKKLFRSKRGAGRIVPRSETEARAAPRSDRNSRTNLRRAAYCAGAPAGAVGMVGIGMGAGAAALMSNTSTSNFSGESAGMSAPAPALP